MANDYQWSSSSERDTIKLMGGRGGRRRGAGRKPEGERSVRVADLLRKFGAVMEQRTSRPMHAHEADGFSDEPASSIPLDEGEVAAPAPDGDDRLRQRAETVRKRRQRWRRRSKSSDNRGLLPPPEPACTCDAMAGPHRHCEECGEAASEGDPFIWRPNAFTMGVIGDRLDVVGIVEGWHCRRCRPQ